MHYKYLTLFSLLSLLFASCDRTPGVVDPTQPVTGVENVEINPKEITFSNADGVKDTTVQVSIYATLSNQISNDSFPRFTVKDVSGDTLIVKGKLDQFNKTADRFEGTADIPLNTTDIRSLAVYVYAVELGDNTNWIKHELNIQGYSSSPPTIIEASNPDTVQIPNDGSVIPVSFTAKVTDVDGQKTIDRVLMNIIDENGNSLSSQPFRLYDDGQHADSRSSGDQVAGDSVYTRRFYVDSTNSAVSHTVHYFAKDKGGLVSDTVTTTFTLVK